MKHRAKVDWWIGASLVLGLIVPPFGAATSGSTWMYGLAAIPWILVFGFCYPQWYETTSDALVIRSGLVNRIIPYSTITAVRPSSDSRSALAMSLDRVQVEYASGELLIAPNDQPAFFDDLAARTPHLARRGSDLITALY